MEILLKYSSYLFYIGLFLSFLMFILIFSILIFSFISRKNLHKILLSNGYDILSEKIKNIKIFIANNPKSKEWQEVQLIYKEFRHLNIPNENKKLKYYQSINKISFIISIVFLYLY